MGRQGLRGRGGEWGKGKMRGRGNGVKGTKGVGRGGRRKGEGWRGRSSFNSRLFSNVKFQVHIARIRYLQV